MTKIAVTEFLEKILMVSSISSYCIHGQHAFQYTTSANMDRPSSFTSLYNPGVSEKSSVMMPKHQQTDENVIST